MGHVAESINTLFQAYATLRFQRSLQGAQWKSPWGRGGLQLASVSNKNWVELPSYRSITSITTITATRCIFSAATIITKITGRKLSGQSEVLISSKKLSARTQLLSTRPILLPLVG